MRYFWISDTSSGHIHAESDEEAIKLCPLGVTQLYSETSIPKNTIFIPVKLNKCGH